MFKLFARRIIKKKIISDFENSLSCLVTVNLNRVMNALPIAEQCTASTARHRAMHCIHCTRPSMQCIHCTPQSMHCIHCTPQIITLHPLHAAEHALHPLHAAELHCILCTLQSCTLFSGRRTNDRSCSITTQFI